MTSLLTDAFGLLFFFVQFFVLLLPVLLVFFLAFVFYKVSQGYVPEPRKTPDHE